MTTSLPQLSRDDIAEEVKRYLAAGREHYLFALHGTGEEQTILGETTPSIHVLPVRSELELRMRLLELPDEQTPTVFLVPFERELPMDLAGRFALEGRVRHIGRHERLRRLFGAREVSDEAARSPLADYLLTRAGELSLSTGELLLSERHMWETWLQRAWKLDARGGLALDSLLAWAATDDRGARFASAMQREPAVHAALMRFLEEHLGPAGPIAWSAWERGEGERLLQYALLFEALRDEPGVAVWLRLQAQQLGVEAEAERERVARQLGEAVSTALPLYASAAGDDRAALPRLLDRADALVDDPQVRAALVASIRLPSGFRLRLEALGEALSEAAAAPDREGLRRVLDKKSRLEAHASYLDDSHDRQVKRAEMAVRLLAWLVSDRSELEPGTTEAVHRDVERLGRWYAEQGGFVDWARRVARAGQHDAFDHGVAAVVAAADAVREQLDLRFAGALAAWVQAKRPAHEVLPIDQVSRRVVAPYLSGHDERKLLVLLLDGMAWAQAVEILEDLGEQPDGWGIAAWHAHGRKHKLGAARTPVVLAGLPTLTEVSRAAFFAGKPMPPGRKHETRQDPDRWRDNPHLARFFSGAEYPRAFLRGEGHMPHGVASREALTAIGQSDQRVVAVVINAIDASLKGDSQHWHDWKVGSIRPLPELLAAAKEHGRSVLLASDHGHVPSDRFEEAASGGDAAAARWRPLKYQSDPVEPYEVKLRGEGVWVPKGAEAVALLADDRRKYGGGAHAGEHGGATLAEVVAPCVLIHWDDPQGAQVDPDRTPRGLIQPDWWHFDVAPAVTVSPEPAPTAPPKPRRGRGKRAVPQGQLPLGHIPGVSPEPTASQSAAPPTSAPSAAARVLQELPSIKGLAATERSQVLATVDYLLARDGIAQLSALASHLGLPPFRMQGFVARRLQRALNLDGFQVITYDPNHVRLDRAILEQQFGVEP